VASISGLRERIEKKGEIILGTKKKNNHNRGKEECDEKKIDTDE